MKAKCSFPDKVLVQPLDMVAIDSFKEAVEHVEEACGRIDILVNNAGVSQRSRAMDTDLSTVRKIMETNFFGTVALTQLVLPGMIERGAGQLGVTSSVVGKFGAQTRSSYAASKHALHGYFDSLRAELHEKNISVTIVTPGYIKTQISFKAFDKGGQQHGKLDRGQADGMECDVFARKMVAAVYKRKEEVAIGGFETWGIILKRFWPRLFSKVVRKAKID